MNITPLIFIFITYCYLAKKKKKDPILKQTSYVYFIIFVTLSCFF